MTPIFPPEADTYVFNLEAHDARQEDFTARFIEDFKQLAQAREVKQLVLDTERVRLPKSFTGAKIEHVRGLGSQVWASSHPRVGMGA